MTRLAVIFAFLLLTLPAAAQNSPSSVSINRTTGALCANFDSQNCVTLGTISPSAKTWTPLGPSGLPFAPSATVDATGCGVAHISGLLKGNGTSPCTAASPLTDYVPAPTAAGQLSAGPVGSAVVSSGCVAAEAYGAKPSLADNTFALQAAVAAAPTGCVQFGPGTFAFTQAVSYSVASNFALRGSGLGSTTLTFSAQTNGLSFTVADGATLAVERLAIVRGYAGTVASNVGLSITGTTSNNKVTLRDLALNGASQTTSWQTGISLTNLGAEVLNNLRIFMPNGQGTASGPTGLSIQGTSASLFAIDAKIDAVAIQGGHIGLNIGAWVQGIFMSNSEMIGDDYGVYWNAPNTGGELLTVVNSHMNSSLGGFYGNGISQSIFSGNLVLRFGTVSSPWAAFNFTGSNNLTITGNQVYGQITGTETGVSIASTDGTGNQPNTITGNSIAALNGPGITLKGTVNLTTAVGNALNGVLGGGFSVTNCPAWTASTAYALGQCVSSNSASYTVGTAGTSASSGTGPSGAGSVTDGTVMWQQVGGLPTNGNVAIGTISNGAPDISSINGNIVVSEGILPNGSLSIGSGSAPFGAMWANQIILKNGSIASAFTIDAGGNVSLSSAPQITLPKTIASAFRETLTTPVSSSAACTSGDFTDDANYHYVCTATNTWKRVALTPF